MDVQMSTDYIDPIAYEAWLTVEKSITGAACKKVWNVHDREEILQETIVLLCARYQVYLIAEGGKYTFDFSPAHVKTTANTCLTDAVRNFVKIPKVTGDGKAARKADKAQGGERPDSEYEHISFCDTGALAEIATPGYSTKSASELAGNVMANAIMELANSQSGRRFAQVCALLIDGYKQIEISILLKIGESTITKLIARIRDLLLAQMQLAAGGC